MNRLIIVGNGYDLSLENKTSYKDFFYWYFKNIIHELSKPTVSEYKDGIWKLRGSNFATNTIVIGKTNLDFIYRKLITHFQGLHGDKPILLPVLMSSGQNNWVDIEQTYFNTLCEVSGINKYHSDSAPVLKKIIRVNEELNTLSKKLHEYLNELNYNETKPYPFDWHEIKKPFNLGQLNKKLNIKPSPDLNRVLILNFNYTNTVKPLINKLKEQHVKVELINIHGQLTDNNQIIFGYGDETIDSYEKLQNLNINECLRNIKSFKYLESNKYQKLMNFIYPDYFDVLILGHSCGISDRVLLESIFEDEHCLFIKPFIYKNPKTGQDDYFDKTSSISRHFNKNQQMRDKVASKIFCPYFD